MIGLSEEDDIGVLLRDPVCGAISGAIIHNDQFVDRIGLGLNRIDRHWQAFEAIMCRNDDRHGRRGGSRWKYAHGVRIRIEAAIVLPLRGNRQQLERFVNNAKAVQSGNP